MAIYFEQSAGYVDLVSISEIIVASVQVFATIVGLLLMDKAGRKILIIISSFVMLLSLGIYFYQTLINALHLKLVIHFLNIIFPIFILYIEKAWLTQPQSFTKSCHNFVNVRRVQ